MASIPVIDDVTAAALKDPQNAGRRVAFVSVTYFDMDESVIFVPRGVNAAEHVLPTTGSSNIYLPEMSSAVLETTVISQDKKEDPTQIMAARWVGSGGSYRCLSSTLIV